MSKFTISRTFAAPRKLVYECWVNPDHFARWFSPAGCETTLTVADIRPGGIVRQRTKFPDCSEFVAQYTFRELSPIDSIVFVTSFCDEDGAPARHPFITDWPERLLASVTFEDDGKGTRVNVEWDPIEATDAEVAKFDEGKPLCHEGWSGTFDQLDGFLEELVPAPR